MPFFTLLKDIFRLINIVDYVCVTAQNEVAGKGVGISDELITLQVMSPDVCDLTLIDLPGIARVPLKGQPEDIGEQVQYILILYFIFNIKLISIPF